jgi:predicted Zn-dependent peptidase
VGAVVNLPDRIAALTGSAVRQAAQTYLDTSNYVKVTLMPAGK